MLQSPPPKAEALSCEWCRKPILGREDRTIINGIAYHHQCFDAKIKARPEAPAKAATCAICGKTVDPGAPHYRRPRGTFHATCYETTNLRT